MGGVARASEPHSLASSLYCEKTVSFCVHFRWMNDRVGEVEGQSQFDEICQRRITTTDLELIVCISS